MVPQLCAKPPFPLSLPWPNCHQSSWQHLPLWGSSSSALLWLGQCLPALCWTPECLAPTPRSSELWGGPQQNTCQEEPGPARPHRGIIIHLTEKRTGAPADFPTQAFPLALHLQGWGARGTEWTPCRYLAHHSRWREGVCLGAWHPCQGWGVAAREGRGRRAVTWAGVEGAAPRSRLSVLERPAGLGEPGDQGPHSGTTPSSFLLCTCGAPSAKSQGWAGLGWASAPSQPFLSWQTKALLPVCCCSDLFGPREVCGRAGT